MTPKQKVQERFPLAFAFRFDDYASFGEHAWRVVLPQGYFRGSISRTLGLGGNATAAWRDAANRIAIVLEANESRLR